MQETQQTLPPAERAQLLRTFIESASRTKTASGGKVSGYSEDEIATKDTSESGRESKDLAELAKYIDGVHLDLYKFFDFNVADTSPKVQRRLTYIQSWVDKTGGNTDASITKLRRLMIKLGNWPVGEAKLDTVYNWLVINGNA